MKSYFLIGILISVNLQNDKFECNFSVARGDDCSFMSLTISKCEHQSISPCGRSILWPVSIPVIFIVLRPFMFMTVTCASATGKTCQMSPNISTTGYGSGNGHSSSALEAYNFTVEEKYLVGIICCTYWHG